MNSPLIQLKQIHRYYPMPRSSMWTKPQQLHALRGVDLTITTGKNIAIVGESGSGKSTLARIIMALEKPDDGQVFFQGEDLHALDPEQLRDRRQHFQMVFQDPYSSLDPRQRIEAIVTEPLSGLDHITRIQRREKAQEMLSNVGLRADDLQKYPHEFSGGQRQRIALARALITRPQLVVADEPLSALDVSVQAQMLNLMMDLQDLFGMTYLLISHDLAVVKHLCDDVYVMQNGQIVEQGSPHQLFTQPTHPCTQALVQAASH
ncbi:MAG: ATP-binding cassette domain-containing protein [Limnohabitans sp.]|nr:ATP-binding cassette domain-containing protein [Limnohabitans sp.]